MSDYTSVCTYLLLNVCLGFVGRDEDSIKHILAMTIKPFKLERYFSIHEFTAEYPLCNSDCESMSIEDLLSLEEGAKEKFMNQWLGYTETKGNPALRQDISATYHSLKSEDVLVCAGAQEPIFLFCQALLKAGDEAIIQFPCYQSVQSIPESMGCKVLNWEVRYKAGKPSFDLDTLRRLITNKTKVLFLNTPHNPTGFHFTKEEQAEIVEIARQNGIFIFSDEVYRELEHRPEYAISAFADVYEDGISLGVMSKSYGLPGLRIGWLAAKNHKILESVAVLKEYTSICSSGPSEFLAGVGLRNRQSILARNLSIVKHNLPLLDTFFAKYAHLFSWYKPHAGPIAWVQLKIQEDDMAFAQKVIKEKKVLLLPGELYEYPGYFRVGFGRKHMPKSLEKFEEFIMKNYPNS